MNDPYNKNNDKSSQFINSTEDECRDIMSNTLYNIFDLIHQGSVFFSIDSYKILHCNNCLLNISQYTLNDVQNKPIDDIVFIDNSDIKKYIDDSLKIKSEICDKHKAVFKCKDGSEQEVEISIKSLEEFQPNTAVLMITEAVDLIRMENLLIRNQKLETLNSMIGGIAHDFNNIQTGIAMNVELIKNKIEPTNIIYNYLNSIEVGIKQSRKLTQQMQSFNENSTPVKRIRSLRELLVDSISFTLRGSNVVSKFSTTKDLWFVNVDSMQINQALSNIALNSVQSMPNGGILTVCVENTKIPESSDSKYFPGLYLKVQIKDQGVGIPQQNMDKIFDKFFTTDTSKAGLGLSVAKTIIQNHDGYIDIDSEINVGTTVTIHLPAFEPSTIKKNNGTRKKHNVGKILLMDDDETILNPLKSYLTEIGYEVEAARDGKEAIRLFTSAFLDEDSFDIAILDLTIPGGLGGKQTIEKLKKIDPDCKSIVTSGYTNDPIIHDYKKFGFDNVILKPYDLKELQSILDNLLKD